MNLRQLYPAHGFKTDKGETDFEQQLSDPNSLDDWGL